MTKALIVLLNISSCRKSSREELLSPSNSMTHLGKDDTYSTLFLSTTTLHLLQAINLATFLLAAVDEVVNSVIRFVIHAKNVWLALTSY